MNIYSPLALNSVKLINNICISNINDISFQLIILSKNYYCFIFQEIKYSKKKICKVWDLNPRVLSTNDLKSLPLDRSGNLAM